MLARSLIMELLPFGNAAFLLSIHCNWISTRVQVLRAKTFVGPITPPISTLERRIACLESGSMVQSGRCCVCLGSDCATTCTLPAGTLATLAGAWLACRE
jgi:hypothetical protein